MADSLQTELKSLTSKPNAISGGFLKHDWRHFGQQYATSIWTLTAIVKLNDIQKSKKGVSFWKPHRALNPFNCVTQ